MPNLHKFVYYKIDRPKNYYFPESLQITDSYHHKKQQLMPSRYWAKRTFCWNACSLNKTSDAGCIFYILLLTISLYTYMNYLGIRYKLEKIYVWAYFKTFNSASYHLWFFMYQKKKTFCSSSIFLGLSKRKLIIKVSI